MVAPHTLPSDFPPLWNELRGKVLVAGGLVLRSLELSAAAVKEGEHEDAVECYDIHETIEELVEQIRELGRRLLSVSHDEDRLARSVAGVSMGQILVRLSNRSLEVVTKAQELLDETEEARLLDSLFAENNCLLRRAVSAFTDGDRDEATEIGFEGAERLDEANRIHDRLRGGLRRAKDPSLCSITLIQLTRIEQEITGLTLEIARELLSYCDSRACGLKVSR